ncbi:asparaginase [Sciscionella sediminilitoris]|uniref:asparaginase n=1 Tax=Sciscionella sediminilitoris TaxID=1445613 RepID=UPI0005624BC6|nr:asparaginase [Sciscionella sp. SE31]
MTRIRLIATGGTIASRHHPQGLRAGATGSELLDQAGLTGIEVEDLRTAGSFALSTADALTLAVRVDAALREGVDGVVVTHGTDTMEESCFLLDLFRRAPAPVVFTGAQRGFDDPAADGPANLAAACAVASSTAARGLGALLAFDGLVWQARGVRKVETLRSGAFEAPGRGPCLRVTPSGITRLATQPRGPAFTLSGIDELPRVDVVSAYLGADDALPRAAVAAGARGIVLQATGAGNSAPALTGAVESVVAQGIPVVVCSRVPSGPVAPIYTGGGGTDLSRAGAVFGSDLSPWQARLLLAVAIATRPHDPGAAVRDWLEKENQTEH